MKKILLNTLLITLFGIYLCVSANATVINFNELSNGSCYEPMAKNYGGIIWGTSTVDTLFGAKGKWYWKDNTSNVYLENSQGPDCLSFTFQTPVTFNGAWFSKADNAANHATAVRFKNGTSGQYSRWLELGDDMQFLSADFLDATTIIVERTGTPSDLGGMFYSMDDITYNHTVVPEPSSILAVLLGLIPVGIIFKRRNIA